jgi:hypothetical protein
MDDMQERALWRNKRSVKRCIEAHANKEVLHTFTKESGIGFHGSISSLHYTDFTFRYVNEQEV